MDTVVVTSSFFSKYRMPTHTHYSMYVLHTALGQETMEWYSAEGRPKLHTFFGSAFMEGFNTATTSPRETFQCSLCASPNRNSVTTFTIEDRSDSFHTEYLLPYIQQHRQKQPHTYRRTYCSTKPMRTFVYI